MVPKLPGMSLTADGQHRRKTTVACDLCRKRKARCDGVAPCSLCVKHSFRCEISTERQKRGPRPKSHNTKDSCSKPVAAQPARPSIDEALDHTLDSFFEYPLEVPLRVRPTFTEPWHVALRKFIAIESSFPGGHTDASFGLLHHLVEIFLTHVNNQQSNIFAPNDLYKRLAQGQCSAASLYAICAVSAKFSRNPAITTSSGKTLGQTLAVQARRHIREMPNLQPQLYLDRVQTYCILILYSFGIGDGAQVWLDIGSAHGLIQILAATMQILPTEHAGFELTHRFLGIAERQLILGYNDLSPSTKFSLPGKHLPTGPTWSNDSSASFHFLQLLDLLLKIRAISSTPLNEQSQPPWMSDSLFMSIRGSLDEYLLKTPEFLQFGSSQFAERVADNNNAGDYILCSLAWHCCVIALNLRFLPLNIPQTAQSGTKGHPDLNSIKFRSVPKTFLLECITACETSAASICIIGTEAVINERFLLPPFMGWSCFQSSIVLINELSRQSSVKIGELSEKIQQNNMILDVMSKFYKPAEAWSKCLAQLQNPVMNSIRLDALTSPYEYSYFGRFESIKEPAYISLMPQICTSEEAMSFAASDLPSIDDLESMQSIFPSSTQTTPLEDKWMEEYQDCLHQYLAISPTADTDLQSGEDQSQELETADQSQLSVRDSESTVISTTIGASQGSDKQITSTRDHQTIPLSPHNISNNSLGSSIMTASMQQSLDLDTESNTGESNMFSKYQDNGDFLHPYFTHSNEMDFDWTHLGNDND